LATQAETENLITEVQFVMKFDLVTVLTSVIGDLRRMGSCVDWFREIVINNSSEGNSILSPLVDDGLSLIQTGRIGGIEERIECFSFVRAIMVRAASLRLEQFIG